MDTKLFCSGEYVLKKCVYHAFAAKVYSELEAKEVIERVGRLVKNIDVCPFAVRLMVTTTLEEQHAKEQKLEESKGVVEVEGTQGIEMGSEETFANERKHLFQMYFMACLEIRCSLSFHPPK